MLSNPCIGVCYKKINGRKLVLPLSNEVCMCSGKLSSSSLSVQLLIQQSASFYCRSYFVISRLWAFSFTQQSWFKTGLRTHCLCQIALKTHLAHCSIFQEWVRWWKLEQGELVIKTFSITALATSKTRLWNFLLVTFVQAFIDAFLVLSFI